MNDQTASFYGAVINADGQIVLTGKRKTEDSALDRALKLAAEINGTSPVAVEAPDAKTARETVGNLDLDTTPAPTPAKPRGERKTRTAFDPNAVRFVDAMDYLVSKTRIIHADTDCSFVKRATAGLTKTDAADIEAQFSAEDTKYKGGGFDDPEFIAAHACRYCAVQPKELADATV